MWQFVVQPNHKTLLRCSICILWKSFWDLLNFYLLEAAKACGRKCLRVDDGWGRRVGKRRDMGWAVAIRFL